MNRRTGRIARLTKAQRDVVNTMLRDGSAYRPIMEVLAKDGIVGVTDSNLHNWVEGGYKEWLNEQERLADMTAKREFALEVVKQNEGNKIHEATLTLAASQLYEVITDFDLSALKELLATKPENYANIVNSLAKLSKTGLDYDKYRDHVTEQKRKIEAELGQARGGGLTAENIAKIEEALNLL